MKAVSRLVMIEYELAFLIRAAHVAPIDMSDPTSLRGGSEMEKNHKSQVTISSELDIKTPWVDREVGRNAS
jgi:hypothetical protein